MTFPAARVAGAFLVAAVVAAAVAATGGAAAAGPEAGVVSGGGSLTGQVVPLPKGAGIAPIHSVHLANGTAAPIVAEWYATVPPGVVITPSVTRVTLAPGETTTVVYSVATDPSLLAGDYEIQVGLRRVETDPATNQVAFLPAFGSNWTLRVVDSSAGVRVEVDHGSQEDVVTLARVTDTSSFVMARGQAPRLRARVAPGTWRAEVQRDGRPLATRTLTVGDFQQVTVRLDARTGRSALGGAPSASWWPWVVAGGLVVAIGVAGAVALARRRRPASGGPAARP